MNPFDEFDEPRAVVTPGSIGGLVVQKKRAPLAPLAVPLAEGSLARTQMDNRITEATLPDVVRKTKADADKAGEGARTASQEGKNPLFERENSLRAAFGTQDAVKDYRNAAASLGVMLQTPDNGGGDIQIVYNYIKSQGPGPVAQGELDLANSVASFREGLEQKYGKITSSNRLPPRVRMELIEAARQAVSAKKGQFDQVYTQFRSDAERSGLNPESVTGRHPADAIRTVEEKYIRKHGGVPHSAMSPLADADPLAPAPEAVDRFAPGTVDPETGAINVDIEGGGQGEPLVLPPTDPNSYDQSLVSQGLSGINKGIAGLVGAPADLMTGAINLGSTGINALANANIPQIENPTLGSGWIKDNVLTPMGAIGANATSAAGQFANRVGESVGASMIPAGFAGNAARAGGQLIAGALGGVGGATARQVFPGNPLAEMAGEIIGGGAGGLGVVRAGQRRAQDAIDAAVPSSDQLREQAGQLYRQAESRGIVADPQDTATLANDIRRTLTDEGQITPGGSLSAASPKITHAMRMADEYAGVPMNPTQMQVIRKSAMSARGSPDAQEARLGSLLTNQIDDWAAPIAPELSDARGVASRYLTAAPLERARELAVANNSKYTQSGLENGLRQEYRGLDRANIRGTQQFSDDVSDAIETVNRGTIGTNWARNIGKLAPTGVISGSLPTLVGASLSGGNLGMAGVIGAGAATAGIIGRALATRGGLRAADVAELTARNGGALPQAPMITPEVMRLINTLGAAEAVKYLTPEEQTGINGKPNGNPNLLARREGQRHLAPMPGALGFPIR